MQVADGVWLVEKPAERAITIDDGDAPVLLPPAVGESPLRAATARTAADNVKTPGQVPPVKVDASSSPDAAAPAPADSDDIAVLLAELRSRPDANPCRGVAPPSAKQRQFMKALRVPQDMQMRIRTTADASIIIDEQLARRDAGRASMAIDTRGPQ